jgi:hypothetical protein
MKSLKHVAGMGEMRNSCKTLVITLEGKRTPERPGCRWEDNIEVEPTEVG